MKFDKDGNILEFEIGDTYSDDTGKECVILHVGIRKEDVGFDTSKWILFQRHSDNQLYIIDPSLLRMRFNAPPPKGVSQKHFYEFKHNSVDELNKTFK